MESLADSFSEFAAGFRHRLPYFLGALIALLLTALAARLVRRAVERTLRRADAERHVVVVVATLASYLAVAVGLVVALSIGGVNLGVLIGSLGLATVALGFALQDIVSNFSAGIVLLLEHPFTEGDHIAIAEAEGEVEEIRVRATRLRAPDGELVIVPNKLLFTQVLTNSSATMRRRVEVSLEVPYGQDLARARELLLAAAGEVEGVSQDPAPRLLTQDLGQGTRSLRLWFWVDARRHDALAVRSALLEQAERRLGGLLGGSGGEASPPDEPGTPSGKKVRSEPS